MKTLFVVLTSALLYSTLLGVKLEQFSPTAITENQQFFNLNDKMFYVAKVDSTRNGLWVTDGTEEGTYVIDSLSGGNWDPDFIMEFKNKLLYNYDRGLWITDGTNQGTFKLIDNGIMKVTKIEYNKVYFFGFSSFLRHNHFVTDGTPEGTEILFDFYPMRPKYSFNINDKIVFYDELPNSDTRSYFSLDHENDTINVIFTSNTKINSFAEYNGMIYFTKESGPNSMELWSTDGTKEGTGLVKEIKTQKPEQETVFQIYKDRLYFINTRGFTTTELWSTDGTEDSTKFIKELSNYFDYDSVGMEIFNDKLLIAAQKSNNYFWLSDGSAEGTYNLTAHLFHRWEIGQPNYFTSNNKLYFTAADNKNEGLNLYYTTGEKDSIYELLPQFDIGVEHLTSHAFIGHSQNEILVRSFVNSDDDSSMTRIINTQDNSITDITNVSNIKNSRDTKIYFFEDLLIYPYVDNDEDFKRAKVFDRKTNVESILEPEGTTTYKERKDTLYFHEFNGDLYFFEDYFGEGNTLWRIKGTPVKDTVIVIDTIPADTSDFKIDLYPNPVTDYVKLELSESTYLYIFNSTGQLVIDLGEIKETTIDLSTLYPGVYYITNGKLKNLEQFVME